MARHTTTYNRVKALNATNSLTALLRANVLPEDSAKHIDKALSVLKSLHSGSSNADYTKAFREAERHLAHAFHLRTYRY